jgi:hypothetical protein
VTLLSRRGDADGRVTAESDGGTQSHGRFFQERIYLDKEVYALTRDRAGFRALSQNSHQTVIFSRNRGDEDNGRELRLDDLIGQNASLGESELRNRGFRQMNAAKNLLSYAWWYQERTKQCVMVVTSDGRYEDIVSVENRICRN